ncbi:hypothetical protein HAX54_003622 [Datura stramonium]|uniref:Uncharacterized protein n=1 Tax=Datura stramonium TaxID=4076 RepID=A0ABS8T6U4_DATST|nr:hypothetical protein [Datura stramonium]
MSIAWGMISIALLGPTDFFKGLNIRLWPFTTASKESQEDSYNSQTSVWLNYKEGLLHESIIGIGAAHVYYRCSGWAIPLELPGLLLESLGNSNNDEKYVASLPLAIGLSRKPGRMRASFRASSARA